jgi:hypothetical protein
VQLVLKFRNMLPNIVREELDSLCAIITGFWSVEHKADGTHSAISCDSLTVGGKPVTGGSGGGTATLPTTTKGDLIAHDGAANVRVPVGSIGRVLTADPSAAPGVSWQIPTTPVTGPGSAVTDHLSAFADTTGKVLKDSGIATNNVPLLDAPINRFAGELALDGPAVGDFATRLTLTDNGQVANQRDWQLFNGSTLLAVVALDDSPLGFEAEFDFKRDGTFYAPKISASGGLLTTPLNPASLTGPVAIAKGGTGQATKTEGFDALSPSSVKGDLIGFNGADNVRVPVGADGYLATADAASAAGIKWQGPDLSMPGKFYERGRTTPMGEWITIPYSAGIFTASGSMLWNVPSAPLTLAYTLVGRTAYVFFNIAGSFTGTASTDIFITLPFNPTISCPTIGRVATVSPHLFALVYFLVGSSKLGIQPFAGGNFALSANCAVQGFAVCQI